MMTRTDDLGPAISALLRADNTSTLGRRAVITTAIITILLIITGTTLAVLLA